MKKKSDAPINSQSDISEKLVMLLKQEGKIHVTPDLQDLYDRLYQSLYIMRDFSVDFEVQQSKTFRGRILKLYRRIWRIGASPYIRYHNQFHATLINTLFIQNSILKELEAKINQRVEQNNER
jgi:hypothetical protein